MRLFCCFALALLGAVGASSAATELLFQDDFSTYGTNTSNLNLNLPTVDGSAYPTNRVRQNGTVGTYGYTKQGGDANTQLGNATTAAGQAGAPGYADYLLLAYSGAATCHLPLNEALAQGQPLTISFDLGTALPPGYSDPAWWVAVRLGAAGDTWPVVGGSADFAFLLRINKNLQVFTTTIPGTEYAAMPSRHFTLVLTDTDGTGSAFAGNGTTIKLYNGTNWIGDFETGQFTEKYLNFLADNAFGSLDNLTVARGLPDFLAQSDAFTINITNTPVAAGKVSLSWAAQFGESYQLFHAPSSNGPWTARDGLILADDIAAGMTLDLTDTNEFFKVKRLSVAEAATGEPQVLLNATNHTITLANGQGDLQIHLKYDHSCLVDHVRVNGKETVAAATGVATGIEVNGNWVTTRSLANSPDVSVTGTTVILSNIVYATGGVSVRETWQFQVAADRVQWQIARTYLTGGTLQDTYFPGWDFASVGTWTAGILDTGGVAWMRYLSGGASYGEHSGAVTFWKNNTCLRVTPEPVAGQFAASRFSHQPSGALTFAESLSGKYLGTQHDLHRSISGMDVWAPFAVTPGTVTQTLTLDTPDITALRNRGSFAGVDGAAVGNVLDTIARYGVVDRQIVGGNGWLSGYVCLHEPFFAEMALAIGDPNYTANLQSSLDAWRDHALQANGRVYSRWHHDTSDNMVPGTYDPTTGYYECGWGYLLDSNSDYPINVAELFDLNGDLAWLQSQKEPCERALNYLLSRDSNGNGLVEMISQNHTEGKSSDWIDVVWASWENAFVNAKLYNALNLWSARETILGDTAKAAQYQVAADKLKATFIKPVAQGGFWDPTNGWFVYWRDKNGSIHGNNLVTPVNFAAVAYGLCDTNQQQQILNGIQTRMTQENLFHWPICFLPFAADEGAAGATFPTYENGDIFLSWGELAVRAYAAYQPSNAIYYVKRLLTQYQADGLSYQRYLRNSQAGAGDDILAGNAMTVVGLYRDLYGIRPQWNRLLLAPHLTPELAGTTLRYPLRGQTWAIALQTNAATASADECTVTAPTPFAVAVASNTVSFWPGATETAALTVTPETVAAVQIQVASWQDAPTNSCTWSETASVGTSLTHTLSGLAPNQAYALSVDGGAVQTLTTDGSGSLTFQRAATANVPATIALQLNP